MLTQTRSSEPQAGSSPEALKLGVEGLAALASRPVAFRRKKKPGMLHDATVKDPEVLTSAHLRPMTEPCNLEPQTMQKYYLVSREGALPRFLVVSMVLGFWEG